MKPDDFEFQTCIGKGSFGKVYLARHKTEDITYAVKVVSKALIKRKREERHIMAERDVLVKNTRHPFLVSLQYSFQTPEKLYFVMDFVNGGEVGFDRRISRSHRLVLALLPSAERTSLQRTTSTILRSGNRLGHRLSPSIGHYLSRFETGEYSPRSRSTSRPLRADREDLSFLGTHPSD